MESGSDRLSPSTAQPAASRAVSTARATSTSGTFVRRNASVWLSTSAREPNNEPPPEQGQEREGDDAERPDQDAMQQPGLDSAPHGRSAGGQPAERDERELEQYDVGRATISPAHTGP